MRQWQGPARALPGGGGGGAFWSVSAVGGCDLVADGSGWPDTPFRRPHWPLTIPRRRRHPHPAATDFFPPTTPVSTANATPSPSRRSPSPLASPTPSLPLATPPHPDAIRTRQPLTGRACLSSSSSPRTPRRTLASLLVHDLAGHARRSLLLVALSPPPPFPRRTGRPCCFAPSACRAPRGPVVGVSDSSWTARRRSSQPLPPCWPRTTARMLLLL